LKGKILIVTIYVLDAFSFESMVGVFLYFFGFYFYNNAFYNLFALAILGGIWGFKIKQMYNDIRQIASTEADDLENWFNRNILNGTGRPTRKKLTFILEVINSIFLIYLFYLILI